MNKQNRIFLSPPHMSGVERRYVEQAFDSNYIAPLGPMVDAFEREFSEYTGIPYCLTLSSGTAAMHLALRHLLSAQRTARNIERATPIVIASTLTFIGSVTPAVYENCELRFIDCDRESWNMDPDLLEAELEHCFSENKYVAAVIPTDLYGQCCDLPRIREICDRYEVPLICDAAEAVGAWYADDTARHHAGFAAEAAVYSFNGNKIITSSGGGMLASHDPDLIAHARKLATQAREPLPHYEHTEIGFNYRMSNIVAAVGRGQLGVIDERVNRKREIFGLYKELLGDLPGVTFMPEAEYNRCTRWLTVVLIDETQFGAGPEQVRLALEDENIEARPVWKPMHRQSVFRECQVRGGAVSEEFFKNGLCLPSGTTMTDDDIARVAAIVQRTVRRSYAIN